MERDNDALKLSPRCGNIESLPFCRANVTNAHVPMNQRFESSKRRSVYWIAQPCILTGSVRHIRRGGHRVSPPPQLTSAPATTPQQLTESTQSIPRKFPSRMRSSRPRKTTTQLSVTVGSCRMESVGGNDIPETLEETPRQNLEPIYP